MAIASKLLNEYWVRRIIFQLKRLLVMNGISVLFSKGTDSDYWKKQSLNSRHNPTNYLIPDELTKVLFRDVICRIEKSDSIIEIGCNAGRNLQYLFEKGYHNLSGMDINRIAIENVLKEKYPKLYNACKFYIGNAAEEIKNIPDSSFEIVFSKGVLIHIPPKDNSIFEHMVRISKKYIVIYTSENGSPCPYDFQKIFGKLRCRLIVYRSFFGEGNYSKLPVELYDEKKHFFSQLFLRVYIKNRP